MAEETLPLEVSYIENTSLYTVIDLTEVTVPFYVEIIDQAHDSSLIEIEDLPVFSALNFIEESKVFNITLDSSGKDGKDGLPGKDGIGKPGKDGSSITFESLTPEQIAVLQQPATNAASDLYATITQVLNLLNSMPTAQAWFYLDSKGNLATDYNLYSNKEISAFGIGDTTGGGSSGGAIILDDLTDVIITDPIINQILQYNGNHWVNVSSIDLDTQYAQLSVFNTHVNDTSKHISNLERTNWDTAFNWGNHSGLYYTKSETDNKLSLKLNTSEFSPFIELFNSMFELDGTKIKALKPLYSVGEISAYGIGSEGGGTGGAINLDALTDVTITDATENQILQFKDGEWKNVTSIDLDTQYVKLNDFSNHTSNSSIHITSSERANWNTAFGWGNHAGLYYTKPQTNDLLADKLDVSIFDSFFEYDAVNEAIKAKYKFYSIGEISAYGVGTGGGGIAANLDSLTDVSITSPRTNHILQFNGIEWINVPSINLSTEYALLNHTHSISNIDNLTTVLASKEPAFNKNTAFNKNFGTSLDTVAEGNHLHSNVYDPIQIGQTLNLNTEFRLGQGWFHDLSIAGVGMSGTFHNAVSLGGNYNGVDNWLTQKIYTTDGEMYFRQKTNTGAFTTWRKLFHDGNFSKTQNLLINGSGELTSNYNFTSFDYSKDQSYFSRGCFKYTNGAGIAVTNDEYMTIIPELRYKFEWYSKSSANRGKYYTFIDCYDVDNNSISAKHHMYKAYTLTWLLEPLVNGANYISVYSTANWDNGGTAGVDTYLRSIIFWNYVDSTGYKYAPLTYSRNWYGDMWNPGSINTSSNRIYLKTPWAGGSIPALTWLSNGRDGGSFKYVGNIGNAFPTSWTNYKGIMNGVDFSGTNADGKFAPGTVKVKVGAIMDYQNSSDTAYFANLSFEVDTSIQATIDNLVGKDLKVANITIDSETPELNLVADAYQISKIQFFDDGTKLLGGISANIDNGIDINSVSVSSPDIILRSNSSQKLLVHSTGVAITGNLLATGEITAYQTSDIRLKENIIPIENATEIINKLNPVTYNWNDKAKELNSNKTDKTDIGLIAQELQEVLPNAVGEMYNGEYLGIDYVKVIPYLISAIKELSEEVKLLKMIKDEKTN